MKESLVFNTKIGNVNWDELKQDLMSMPKETLAELINAWLKIFWSTQSNWMVFIEKEFGFDVAAAMDQEIFEKVGPIQAYRVKNILNLGDDVQALAAMFKFTAPQWVTAGFEWEFSEITDKKMVMTIHKCPMGTYRKSNNLELLHCRTVATPLYKAMAHIINDKFRVTCQHAHPDPPIKGVMCQWVCVLDDPKVA